MKILIVTQVVDVHHPILGFFHRWIEEFASQTEKVTVICLQEGDHSLPDNVTVKSLGKEKGGNKFTYIAKFYSYIWKYRNDYDVVFVHMNQIYVILGFLLWKLMNKKIGLWYAHGKVSLSLRIAVFLSNFLFTSTKHGLKINTKKRSIVGQGIDTSIFRFKENNLSKPLKLITVGRISASKNLETLLMACSVVNDNSLEFEFTIVGDSITKEDRIYHKKIKLLAEKLNLSKKIIWKGPISNHKLPMVLQESNLFIHDGTTNSLDKTLLEAVLCGCIVVSSNPAFVSLAQKITPELLYRQNDYEDLAKKIIYAADNFHDVKIQSMHLNDFVSENYTVKNLVSSILKISNFVIK